MTRRSIVCCLGASLIVTSAACTTGLSSFGPETDAGHGTPNVTSGGTECGASPETGGSSSGGAADASTTHPVADAAGDVDAGSMWVLTWADEFDGPNGSAPDPSHWTLVTGGNGWGNEELEYYTTDLANAQIQDGSLAITATTAGASAYQCAYSPTGACQYTSARMQTAGLFSQQYGRFEARIQIPSGRGLWPAFWALGDNISAAGWPTCGEIDIMEAIGSQPSTNNGSLHALNTDTSEVYENVTAKYTLPGGATLSDDFHLYSIEWQPGQIRFYVDDQLYEEHTPANIPAGDQWPFVQPFYLLLNVAVGGNLPGSPDGTTTFPQQMLVDYVRVYAPVGAD